MPTSILRTALMTSVYAGKNTKNYEYAPKHGLGTASGGAILDFIYFSNPVPKGATVTSAKLYLYSAAATGTATHALALKRLNKSVSMTKVTYKTRPTTYFTTPTLSTSKTAPFPAGAEFVIDVTANLQAVANGDAWFGWELSASSNPNINIYGPRWGTSSQRPRLEVTWAILPATPATLSPGGGRLVGLTKPVLRAVYTDVGSDNPLAAVQVQRNDASNDFSGSVTWDSGTVASSTAQLDTSLTTWPALTGPAVYWRMRVQDVNGLWSLWSSPETFGYAAKSTLTLTSPAASPNNVVNDDSPPVTWTFSGTQTAYQVTLLDPATGAQQWTSGKVSSASTTGFSLPPGYVKSTSATYRVLVMVWDDKQREGTPNDPAFVQAQQDFTYALTNTVTPTTGLTATADAVRPKVSLAWSRSSFPDTFTILRNGTVIATELLPGDITTGATTFAYVDPAPLPNVTATYEVTAVVNGKGSSGNSTASATAVLQGMWLADQQRTLEVLIVGKQTDRSWVYGEQSEVLEVIGARQVVVISHGQRGVEGTISGQLRSAMFGLSTTAMQWRDALLALRRLAHTGATLWLTAGDATLPVVVRNVNVFPRAEPILAYDVSFEFYQVAG